MSIDFVEEILENLERSLQSKFIPLPSIEDIELITHEFKECIKDDDTIVANLKCNHVVVGDLHGNFNDLVYIVRKYGQPSRNVRYLFLGDYVDRGTNSIETILYLLCLKILYPDYVTMIRGNHEFTEICSVYGFLDECTQRLGDNEGRLTFDLITSTFPYIPLAAILPNGILCVHGGISSHINHLSDISQINRFNITKSSDSVIVTDLVWGDPRNLESGQLTTPSERGLGENYSLDKTNMFLRDNNLTSIIRAHEACEDGYEQSLVDKDGNTVCLTVFSATNYCSMNNMGAVALVSKDGVISLERFASSSEDEDFDFPIVPPSTICYTVDDLFA